MNMGLSPKHASTVPIVLNVSSGYITTLIHVVFDNWFTTITSAIATLPDFNTPAWSKLFGDSHYQYPFDDDNEKLIVESAASDLPTPQTLTHINDVAAATDATIGSPPLPAPPPPPLRFQQLHIPLSTLVLSHLLQPLPALTPCRH
jgi:hypothetical protein